MSRAPFQRKLQPLIVRPSCGSTNDFIVGQIINVSFFSLSFYEEKSYNVEKMISASCTQVWNPFLRSFLPYNW